MIRFRKNTRTEGLKDRPYYIRPFWLTPSVQGKQTNYLKYKINLMFSGGMKGEPWPGKSQ